jgi:hypothetical protein
MSYHGPVHQVHDPLEIGRYVNEAREALQVANPSKLIEAMAVLLRDDHWQSYRDPLDGQDYTWRDFRRFVHERLNSEPEVLIAFLAPVPRLQAKVLDLASAEKYKHYPDGDIIPVRNPRGTSAAQGMRRLQKERPDLAARVDLPKDDPNRLSVHAATIEAGFRKPMISVRSDSASAAVRTLLKHYAREELLRALETS